MDAGGCGCYTSNQVLNTPQKAVPRAVKAVFLYPIGLLLWGMGLSVRLAARLPACVQHPPLSALNSAAKVSERSNRHA